MSKLDRSEVAYFFVGRPFLRISTFRNVSIAAGHEWQVSVNLNSLTTVRSGLARVIQAHKFHQIEGLLY